MIHQTLEVSAAERLRGFLAKRFAPSEIKIEQLTPDASLREYFRVNWHKTSAVACVYGESFIEKEHSYINVTNLFLISGLPVAKIYDFDGASGVIILEDFGDKILRDTLTVSDDAARDSLLNEAITLTAKIQAATEKAFRINSIASRLKFDEEQLLWELRFFKTHYFESLQKEKLSAAKDKSLTKEFIEISRELESLASVLCHRDFHAANLMIDREDRLRIIDHQDARIGTTSYDLVSLLFDRTTEPPSRVWVREKRLFFLSEREKIGLETLDPDDFAREFHLQTIQRGLKAVGTFSFQSANRGKVHFLPFIKPMFQIVLQACERLERFPFLQEILRRQFDK